MEAKPTPEASPEPNRRRVKHMVQKKKFRPRELLEGIILGAKEMWGRPVIRPSNAEEVCQESASSDNESKGDDDEGETTPRSQSQTPVRDLEDEHTLRTPSAERMGTPPPPEFEGEGISRMSPGSGRPKTPQQPEVPEGPNPESAGTSRPEMPPLVEVQDRPEADPRATGSMGHEAPQLTEVRDRTEVDPGASKSSPC